MEIIHDFLLKIFQKFLLEIHQEFLEKSLINLQKEFSQEFQIYFFVGVFKTTSGEIPENTTKEYDGIHRRHSQKKFQKLSPVGIAGGVIRSQKNFVMFQVMAIFQRFLLFFFMPFL